MAFKDQPKLGRGTGGKRVGGRLSHREIYYTADPFFFFQLFAVFTLKTMFF